MASRHLVALGYLAELRDIDLYDLVDSGAQVLAVLFTAEALDLDDLAAFAVRHAQGGVAHLARLLSEYRAEQLLFRRLVGFALRRHLADEDVAGLDLRADADDAVLVEILQGVFAHVRDIARYLFRAELGVA